MKSKSLLLFCLTVIGSSLFSCSEIEQDMLIVENNAKSEAEFVSDGNVLTTLEAADIANQAYSSFFPVQSRSASVHLMADASDVSIMNGNSSRSDSGDTLIYIVNFPKDGGYALVAAPRSCQERVLAVVPEGNLDADGSTDNPGLKMFLKDALTYASTYAIDPGIGVTPQPRLEEMIYTDTISYVIIGPKTNLKWGQGSPFSEYCDNDAVGCFPLATGMLMSYFKCQNNLQINFKNKKKTSVNKNITIDWPGIKACDTSTKIYFAPNDIKEQIQLILRQIGEYAHSEYKENKDKPNTTSTKPANERKTLQYFLPGKNVSDFTDFDPWNAVSEVKKGLLMMRGVDKQNNSGHAWIAEGCRDERINYYYYYKRATDLYWTFDRRVDSNVQYLYYNWGWYGKDNGYFRLWDMKTSNGEYSEAQYISIN